MNINPKRNAKFLEAMLWSGAPLRAKLATYCALNGLEIKEDLNPGELLRKRLFAQMLIEAKGMLSAEDLAYIEKNPLVISDSAVHQGDRKAVTASATKIMEGEKLTGVVITLYRDVISRMATWKDYTRAERVDWIKRLLQHEIGHARDSRTDEQMAKESNY